MCYVNLRVSPGVSWHKGWFAVPDTGLFSEAEDFLWRCFSSNKISRECIVIRLLYLSMLIFEL